MLTIPIHDFQADIISYLKLITQGEQITVTENGKSLATIASPNRPQKQTFEQINAPLTQSMLGMFEDNGEDYKVTLQHLRMEKFS